METNVKNEILSSAGKALISIIPCAGGPLASIISDYQSYRKEQKVNEFLDSITAKLQHHENMISQISQEYILNDDFFDIFENSLRKVIYERQQEKRIAYSNTLANAIIYEISYDDTELFQHLIDVLTPLHIHVLKEFKNHTQEQNEDFDVFVNRVMIAVKTIIGSDNDFVEEIVGDLESRNLLHPFLSTKDTQNGAGGISFVTDNFVTSKGEKFISYIS